MSPPTGFRPDARIETDEGDILLEVKSTSNARDLRGVLLQLAYQLDEEDVSTTALCILVSTRLSGQRLEDELAQFRHVVRPQLARRVFLVTQTPKGTFEGAPHPRMDAVKHHLMDAAIREPGSKKTSRQSVKAFLMRSWLAHQPPRGIAELMRETDASYKTVVGAIDDLRKLDALRELPDRRVTMRKPSWEVWSSLAIEQARQYRVVRYVDPTGHTTPLRLFKRLRQRPFAQNGAIKIGGVMGAAWYEPELDISAPLRLDLYSYGAGADFVRKLDAGLEPSASDKERPVLILHLARSGADRHSFADYESDEVAPPLECLADLLEMGYRAEGGAFVDALTTERLKEK